MDGSIIRILKFSNALLFKPHPNYIPPLRIFTILYDTCSVPSWFKENTPTAFQINYWPLLSHYKQTLFKISIALCPHWLKLEAWWPHVVPEDRYPMNIHNGLLLHYTNQQQDRNKQKRNKQANLSWRQSKLSPVAPWKTSVVNRNINSLEVMFMILQIADRAKWTLSD